jgi:putative metallohydrolase (TIGR04338 family)
MTQAAVAQPPRTRKPRRKLSHRPRDVQRKHLYEAEREAFPNTVHPLLPDLLSCQLVVDKIVGSAWARRHFPRLGGRDRKIVVGDGRGTRKGLSRTGQNRITLPRQMRRVWVILHELAHQATDSIYGHDGAASHGPEFARVYLMLLRHYLGPAGEERLRLALVAHRCKITPLASVERAATGPVSFYRVNPRTRGVKIVTAADLAVPCNAAYRGPLGYATCERGQHHMGQHGPRLRTNECRKQWEAEGEWHICDRLVGHKGMCR